MCEWGVLFPQISSRLSSCYHVIAWDFGNYLMICVTSPNLIIIIVALCFFMLFGGCYRDIVLSFILKWECEPRQRLQPPSLSHLPPSLTLSGCHWESCQAPFLHLLKKHWWPLSTSMLVQHFSPFLGEKCGNTTQTASSTCATGSQGRAPLGLVDCLGSMQHSPVEHPILPVQQHRDWMLCNSSKRL